MRDLLIVVGIFGFLYLLFRKGGNMLDDVITRMAEAIKTFEGWWPGSRSYRNMNPGNLKYAGQLGAIGKDDGGHAIFSSYNQGWNALIRQLKVAFTGQSHVYNPGMSLYDFFQHYAEGNPDKYAQYVAAQLGVTPDTRLQDLVQV